MEWNSAKCLLFLFWILKDKYWLHGVSLPPLVRAWSTSARRLLLLVCDALLLLLAVYASFALRLAHPWPPELTRCSWLAPAALFVGLIVYFYSGQYQGLTRYTGSRSAYQIGLRNLLIVALLWLLGYGLKLPLPPRSSWLLFWLILTALVGSLRLSLRDLMLALAPTKQSTTVLIYGAGDAGAQLAASLRFTNSHRLVGFIDDNPNLWGRLLQGNRIWAPQHLPKLIARHQPSQVLLAIPSLSRQRQRAIVELVQQLGLTLLQVPSIDDISSGRARIDSLRPVEIEQLLGRDSVTPDLGLLDLTIKARVVLVTGAGGSIGSELCRQIIKLQPRRLLLLDSSEPALYAIDQELQGLISLQGLIGYRAVLGSTTDQALLGQLFQEEAIDSVFHAAAYKHVPLVEANPLIGLVNNSLASYGLARQAAAAGVKHFLLVSTDKAVRPTNVMGASKRLAEMVIQAFAAELGASGTKFACVRFGNVVGSSGSVVPLFRQQIARGGPITLTHPDITRYFMTIPEAVALVLQAAALAETGDVFLLEMGEPVRIADLARQMIQLSGLSLRDINNPYGDIEIEITGLRPGEKLYEELLISATAEATCHPLIYRAREAAVEPALFWPLLERLSEALDQRQTTKSLSLLQELIPEWSSSFSPNSVAPVSSAPPALTQPPNLLRAGIG